MAQPRRGRWSWIRVGALLAVALGALMLLAGGCERRVTAPPSQTLPAGPPAGRLQEVSPPGAVQQLEAALASHRPRLRITSPLEGALLPDGPWQLGLELEDWPLVQDPSLGLGPHLVVQVDDGPRERIGDWLQGEASSGRLNLAMAALAPGSHRVSVYAALPWGEAVKLPGASARLQVHRVAANPLSQPAPGSAQLLAVSPDGLSQSEPVLIDWLLQDAPLQGLRDGDARWRLRISVNGDSFLVDQNTPVWLRGLKPGSNALLLELLDGLGEPLNPPFNSLVREVVIQPRAARPVWLNERLSPTELARLLGKTPPQELPPPAPPRALEPKPEPEPIPEKSASAQTTAAAAGNSQEEAKPGSDPQPQQPRLEQELPPAPGREQLRAEPNPAKPVSEPVPEPKPEQEQEQGQETDQELPLTSETAELAVEAPTTDEPATPELTAEAPADRIQPGTSLSGSAREQVREDGSLIPEQKPGRLSGLAARLRP